MERLVFQRLWALASPSERMRQVHSAWLTRVFQSGADVRLPRIPVRPVSDGGFGPLLSSPGGRERADQWWYDAFADLDAA